MYTRRILIVLTAVAVSLAGLILWASVSTQAEPAGVDLALIGEQTGLVAAQTPISPDCVFDAGYQVYLCEPSRAATVSVADPAARAQALALLSSDGLLLIPDSTNKRIMVFDPISGDLVDPNFVILDDDATGTVIHAILGPTNNILISDQTRNVVHEYDLEGNYLGVFAPAGGEDTSIMQNVRGIALRPNGNLLVSVGGGANANAIAEFDTGGNYVGNSVANDSGGLNSPFDVYQRVGTDWLVSSINNNLVIRYNLATGAPIGDLATINSFPQQILEIGNGNVLIGNFSGTQVGVVELASDGTLIGVRTAPGISQFRGVYELPNGNLLASTSGGVFEIDRSGNLIDTKYVGSSRFIEWAVFSIELQKTVGLDPSVCATTDEISVGPNTAVTYCFEITNNTPITLTLHDLVDSHLGTILDGISLSLMPGMSIFVTQTAVITQSTVNTATWTAYNPGPEDVFAATDSASVTVVPPSIALTKTVGTDSSVCAITDVITVPTGTAVTYCFEVANTGLTTLGVHDLVDSHLGVLLDGFSFGLAPGASVFVTQTAVITGSTVNTATWTAYNLGPTDLVSSTDSATVNVVFHVYLPIVLRE